MPRLSVLLPVRDGAATIGRAVRSTLGALPPDAELVVLDDGSTDGTGDVLSGISDRRLVVHAGAGAGVAAGLTRLLTLTDSVEVGRMDADDVCLPGRFSAQRRALQRADFVFTTVVQFRARPAARIGSVRATAPTAIDVAAFPFHLLLTNPVAHPTMLARRTAIEAAGGYRSVPAEDYDLWLRAADAGARLVRLGRPGLGYRVHATQVTASTEWRTASWRDERTADAYGALSERVLGRRFRRLPSLAIDAGLDDAAFEGELADFGERLDRATVPLGAGERRRLARLRRERFAAVRGIRRAARQ